MIQNIKKKTQFSLSFYMSNFVCIRLRFKILLKFISEIYFLNVRQLKSYHDTYYNDLIYVCMYQPLHMSWLRHKAKFSSRV